MEDDYVYITFDKNDFSVKYVGSGKNNRSEHVLSGRSSSVAANTAVLSGAGDFITIKFAENLPYQFARNLELGLIYALQPEWNSRGLIDRPDIDFEMMVNCLRMKVFVDSMNSCEKYSPDKFDKIYAFCLCVFYKLSGDNIPVILKAVYPYYDEAVEYFLENGDVWEV
jgi:hypothetical protein